MTNKSLKSFCADEFHGFTPPHILSGYPSDTPILVGFSGGADSRLLLHILYLYAKENGTPLYAAHLNHGIRGSEADRDEEFCRTVAAEYGIELFVEHENIPELCKLSGNSTELEARQKRYEFFARVMKENNIPLLATAHNADDVLETLIFRILRGTGTKGLSSIPPVRPLGDGRLAMRPILSYTKAEIVELCTRLGLSFVTDSTNAEEDCARNKIRLRVIPELERIAGSGTPQRSAVRLAASAAEDEDAISEMARGLIKEPRNDGGIPLEILNSAHIAVAKRMIFELYAKYFRVQGVDAVPEDKSLSSSHVDALITLCRRAVKHSKISLPCGAIACIENGMLVITEPSHEPDTLPIKGTVELSLGVTEWDGGNILIIAEEVEAPIKPMKKTPVGIDGTVFASVVLPRDTINMPLYARVRQGGDTIFCHGMTKKLKKLMYEKDIPLELRDRLPLIMLDSSPDADILWCPSVAIRDGVPFPKVGRALRISVILR